MTDDKPPSLFGIDHVPTPEAVRNAEPKPLTRADVLRLRDELIARPKSRDVTCLSCKHTFGAVEYPPKQCPGCGIHFAAKTETRKGDTIEQVIARNARKALRKGTAKRKLRRIK